MEIKKAHQEYSQKHICSNPTTNTDGKIDIHF